MRSPRSPAIKVRKTQNQHGWGPTNRPFVEGLSLGGPETVWEGRDSQELASCSKAMPCSGKAPCCREAVQPGWWLGVWDTEAMGLHSAPHFAPFSSFIK